MVPILKTDKTETTREEGKRSFVRAKKRAHNGRLQAALRAHCVARGARPSAHFGFASTLRRNVL